MQKFALKVQTYPTYVTLTELGISFYPLLQLKLLTQKIERWNFSLRIWVGESERKSPGPFILSCTWTISLNGIARQKFSMWVSYIKDFYHTRTVYTYLCTRIWENRFTCVITYVIQNTVISLSRLENVSIVYNVENWKIKEKLLRGLCVSLSLFR